MVYGVEYDKLDTACMVHLSERGSMLVRDASIILLKSCMD